MNHSNKSKKAELEAQINEKQLFENNTHFENHLNDDINNINASSMGLGLPIAPLMNFDKSNYQSDPGYLIHKYGDIAPDLENSFDNQIITMNDFNGISELKKNSSDSPILSNELQFFSNKKFNPIELFWENLYIHASYIEKKKKCPPCSGIKKEKTIIKDCKGIARPGSFTAILGPSGSGKTTLLNFLSSRMLSSNLRITGKLEINGVSVPSIDTIGNQVAYVMQDDILLATFTPREAFNFAAELRMKLTPEERKEKVNSLIKDLGLSECANTVVGNQLIRGISGGERKRTSIGVELLTNPSLIFLDEPTTGLDSATAYNVLLIMKSLAKKGRTVLSTIHQPSSEIFGMFDKLLLLVQGEIIYQGQADEALDYFDKMGFKSPAFCNPSTFFMKCMNPEGLLVENMQKTKNYNIEFTQEIKHEFKIRVAKMVEFYKNSNLYKDILPNNKLELPQDKHINTVGWFTQSTRVWLRGVKNEFRNPMDVKMKLIGTIFMSIVNLIIFTGLGEYRQEIQNRLGALFFITMNNSFASTMGSLLLFSSEKPLFLRERLNKTYSTSAYFWGRTTSDFFLHLFFPFLSVLIPYFVIGLSLVNAGKFFILVLIQMIVYFTGVSYGLFLSVIFPKAELAMAMIPVIIVPFMVLAGFFVNQSNIPYYFYPIQYLSMFKYGFQASVLNELSDKIWYCSPNVVCDPIAEQKYQEDMWSCIGINFGLGIGLRILSFIGLYYLSNPKRPEIKNVE